MRRMVGLALAVLLAACVQKDAFPERPSPLTPGDAWLYQGPAGERLAAVAARHTFDGQDLLAWTGDPTAAEWPHSIPLATFVRWTDALHGEAGWAGAAQVEAGTMEMRAGPAAPCPVLPAVFQAGVTATARCDRTFHRVMPDGLTMERAVTSFPRTLRVVGAEEVTVSAGTFQAWHVQLTDTQPPVWLEELRTDLWYSPQACAIVRASAGTVTEELVAGRCAATGWAAGALPETPTAPGVDDFIPLPVTLSCSVEADGVAVQGQPLQGEAATCSPGVHAFDPAGLGVARIEATWEAEPGVLGVRLQVADMSASGSSPPVALEIPASSLEDLTVRVQADGAAHSLPVHVRYTFETE